jgi:hypothetical protein
MLCPGMVFCAVLCGVLCAVYCAVWCAVCCAVWCAVCCAVWCAVCCAVLCGVLCAVYCAVWCAVYCAVWCAVCCAVLWYTHNFFLCFVKSMLFSVNYPLNHLLWVNSMRKIGPTVQNNQPAFNIFQNSSSYFHLLAYNCLSLRREKTLKRLIEIKYVKHLYTYLWHTCKSVRGTELRTLSKHFKFEEWNLN